MQKTFDTPQPTELYVELGSGSVDVRCDDVTQTTVDVAGKDADDVVVERRGEQIAVVARQKKVGFMVGFSSSRDQLRIRVTLPHGSALTTRLGSADLVASGRLGETRAKSGSGDVRLEEVAGDATVETGSGDIELGSVSAGLRVRSGSGDVEVDQVGGPASISTASGDVEVGKASQALEVKSASGDTVVRDAGDDVAMNSASGDLLVGRLHRGQLSAKNVSGDIRVGIPAGVPVWTDLSSVSGSVRSNLVGAGRPEEGQDFIELRARTVSGDITLEQL